MGKLGGVLVVVVVAAVAWLGWQNQQLAERVAALTSEVKRDAQRPPMPAPSLASCYLSPQFAQQLAGELRNTLALAPGESVAFVGSAAGASPSAKTGPTPANVESSENANRALDDIIARGRITPNDVDTLRVELAGATSEQRDEVRARIAAALNRNELVAEDRHALFP